MQREEPLPQRLSVKTIVWLIAINVILRAIWLAVIQPTQIADFEWYFTHAAQMAQGQGYVWSGHYTAYWPIGWPLILSILFRITGPHVMTGLIANAVFSIGIVLLVYRTTLIFFRSSRKAAFAAFGYSFLPSQIQWNAILGSEESFTFFLLLALYLYLRSILSNRDKSFFLLAAAGVVMGLATDIRPVTLVFPVVVLIYELVLQRPRWLHGAGRTAVFTVFMALGVLPVTLRNYFVMHHFVLVSTNGGVNLWQGTKIDGGYYWSWLPWENPLLAAKGNEILQNQIGQDAAFQHILHYPMSTLWHGVLKIIDLYKNDVNAVWYTIHVVNPSRTVLIVFDLVTSIAYWLFMALVLVGVGRFVRWPFRTWWPLALPILFGIYYTSLFMFFPAWDRFRYPLMPLFAVFLGLGLATVLDVARNRIRRKNM